MKDESIEQWADNLFHSLKDPQEGTPKHPIEGDDEYDE